MDQWLNRKETDRQNARSKESAYPPFSVFCDFLKREARIACNPVAMSRVIGEERKVQPPHNQRSGWSNRNKPFDARALTTGSEEVKVERKSDKRPCKSAHSLDDCEKFAKMSYAEKLEVVKSNGLCLGCLRYGHMKRVVGRRFAPPVRAFIQLPCTTQHQEHHSRLRDQKHPQGALKKW